MLIPKPAKAALNPWSRRYAARCVFTPACTRKTMPVAAANIHSAGVRMASLKVHMGSSRAGETVGAGPKPATAG